MVPKKDKPWQGAPRTDAIWQRHTTDAAALEDRSKELEHYYEMASHACQLERELAEREHKWRQGEIFLIEQGWTPPGKTPRPSLDAQGTPNAYVEHYEASEALRKLPWYKDGRNDAEREAAHERLDNACEAVEALRIAAPLSPLAAQTESIALRAFYLGQRESEDKTSDTDYGPLLRDLEREETALRTVQSATLPPKWIEARGMAKYSIQLIFKDVKDRDAHLEHLRRADEGAKG